MKKIVLVFGLLSIISNQSFSQQDYFPLEVGNYWQYKVTFTDLNNLQYIYYDYLEVLNDTILIDSSTSFYKIKFIQIAPYFIDSLVYFKYDSISNSILEYREWADNSMPLFDFSAPLYSCWFTWSTLICLTNQDSVEVFGNNRYKKHFHGGNIPDFSFDLAEEFGPVEIFDNQSWGYTTTFKYELVYAKINRIEYGQFVSVREENKQSPQEYHLSQNYPNPFNPSTKISWQSPVSSWQTLKVYDVLGNEVATLVNEYRNAGSYGVEFKSTVGSHQLANGVYFYRLQTGDYVETKKMMLLK